MSKLCLNLDAEKDVEKVCPNLDVKVCLNWDVEKDVEKVCLNWDVDKVCLNSDAEKDVEGLSKFRCREGCRKFV
jgi:hypothetical protein